MGKKKQDEDSEGLVLEKRHGLHGTRTPLAALGGAALALAGLTMAGLTLLGYFAPDVLGQYAPGLLKLAPIRTGKSVLDELFGMMCASSVMVLFGWIFFSAGMTKTENDAARKARLKASGSVAQARLLGFGGGKMRKNQDPVLKLTLEIPRPAGPAKVKVDHPVPLVVIAMLRPGLSLPILLDPHDDTDFLILWERLTGLSEDDAA